VDFVRRWSGKTGIGVGRFIAWLGVGASKFYDWQQRYGRVNEHNGWVPRDFWISGWRAGRKKPSSSSTLRSRWKGTGGRRLTFMMLDADVVAVSPASVWRVLKQAGLLSRWKDKPSRKGTGFEQPPSPHQRWHIDVSYINLSGTFYYLCSVLDGYSRFLVHWDLRESMKEADIEMIPPFQRFAHESPSVTASRSKFLSRAYVTPWVMVRASCSLPGGSTSRRLTFLTCATLGPSADLFLPRAPRRRWHFVHVEYGFVFQNDRLSIEQKIVEGQANTKFE
jgi:hypothetical protein